MKKTFAFHHLTLAVAGVMTSAVALADTTEPTVDLGEAVITIDRQGAKSKTNVVTTAVKDKRTETDLRGLLNEEPAINFGGGNGNSQWWTIRGMGQDQIDVKVDNAYTDTQMFHHQGRFMLDPALVKIVSVQKGAGSASAGIGATSGAIVARTLDAKELLANSTNENLGFKVNAGYSSNDGHNYGASVFGKAGAVDALIAGSWVNNDDYKNGAGVTVKNSAVDQRGLLAKVGVDINDNNRLVASYRQEYSEGVRALREEFDFSLDPNTTRKNDERYREIEQETTMLEYEGKNLGFAERVDANIYRTKMTQYDTARPNRNPARDIAGEGGIEITGANINFDSQILPNTLLKYGVNYRHQEAYPMSLNKTPVNQEKTDTGVYAEAIHDVGHFTLTGGLRYDHFDYTATNGSTAKKGVVNPSFGVIYQALPQLSLSANHYYASRSPRLREVAVSAGNNISVSRNLKPEQARNTEVGFNYNDGNWSADGSYFWQAIDHAHGFRSGNGGLRELYNAGRVKNKGYELGVGYRFKDVIDGLSARVSVAYQEPEIYGTLVDNNTTAIWQGRTYTGSLAYQLPNYPVELGWRGRVVQDSVGTPSRGSGANTTPQVREGYNLHDFYVNWKPYRNDRMNVNFAINNAFDEDYKPHAQRAGTNSLPSVGREFRVGVNFTY